MNQSGLKFFCTLLISFLPISFASAQVTRQSLSPSFVVSGGYSGYNPGGKTSGVEFGRLPNGWNTTAAVQFTHRYSFVADFGRYSNSTVGSTQTYLFGPKFTFHKSAFEPFINIMMGFQRLTPKGLPSYTAFSEGVGGGLDIAVARRFSLRLFQADFIYAADHEKTQLELNQFYGVRVSAGVAWNFGRPHKPAVVAKKTPTPKAKPEPTIETHKEPQMTAATQMTEQPAASVSAPEETKTSPSAQPEVPSPQAEPVKSTDAKPEPAAVTPQVEAAPAPAQKESENKEVEKKEIEQKEAKKGETEPQIVSAEKEDSAIGKPAAASVLTVAEKPVAVSEKATAEKSTAVPEQPAVAPEKPIAAAPPAATPSAIQHVGTLRFPYDQYPTLLSPQDKRSLDAVASRLKLEPKSTAVIVGSAPRGSSPKTAAQRAVNSKDYLVKKGIAADRVKVFARQAEPARTKSSPMKSELVFVPAGTAYDAAADPVDEQHVKPENLHVAHPEWHEK